MAKGKALGTFYDELFEDNSSDTHAAQTLRLSSIEPNKSQPRTDFAEDAIASLTESIQQHGLLQPLLVRPLGADRYQIVAGERRWRACRRLGMTEVPVIIRELSDLETMQIALIENLQRENLNPVEEALGYKSLLEDFGMTQEEAAKTVGKSRSVVANAVRLLKLPENVLELVRRGELSTGHAKVLAGLESEEEMTELANKAANGNLNVRQLERICSERNPQTGRKKSAEKGREKPDNYYKEMEIGLAEMLRRKVKVSYSGTRGKLEIEFYDADDLRSIAEQLTK